MAEILFFLRRNYLEAPGGDTVQMESWRKVLTRLGHQVTITVDSSDNEAFSRAGAVFIWHLERIHDSYSGFLASRKAQKPVFLVPTCWDPDPRITLFRKAKEDIKQRVRQLLKPTSGNWSLLFKFWYICRQNMLKNSDFLLVNSHAESEMLCFQGADPARVRVIPNVIDEELAQQIPSTLPELRAGCVHVGHFCPRKNQKGLLKALSNCDFEVTFAGKARPMHRRYFKECRRIAGTRHNFSGALSRRDVLELMSRSRLSISTSTIETPGIANLEAAALGCVPVVPDIAPVREYFQDTAFYIDPVNIDPEELKSAYCTVPDGRAQKRILENYTEKNLAPLFEALLREVE